MAYRVGFDLTISENAIATDWDNSYRSLDYTAAVIY